MVSIKSLFEIENAKSKGYEKYQPGHVPFVTNGDYDSAVLGYVKPFETDKVFRKKSICLSSFCEACIPDIPFLPRGNGGSGLIVLVPKTEMSNEELFFYATQLNMQRWRFSFSRMLIAKRIENLDLIKYSNLNTNISKSIESMLPKDKKKDSILENKNLEFFQVSDLCEISKKKALPQNVLTVGNKTPYVTTSSFNNGISIFTDEKPNSQGKVLTIALNGSVGEVFFQIDDFITSSDNAVLFLKDKYNPYLLFYIGTLIKTHQWRYNYYRKLTIKKLASLKLPIPIKNGKIDLTYIQKIVENSYGFDKLEKYV